MAVPKRKISKTRGTELRFKETIDLLFIKNIISRIDVNIVYDTTKKHNYYGPNIQLGDNHGICFVFPFAMLIYISKNFKTCFKRFDINSFVCNSLDINVDFDTTVTINLIGRKELIRLTHLSTDAIRKNIAIKKFLFKKKIFFIKRITNYVIEVLTEKRLRDYIKSAYTPPRLPED